MQCCGCCGCCGWQSEREGQSEEGGVSRGAAGGCVSSMNHAREREEEREREREKERERERRVARGAGRGVGTILAPTHTKRRRAGCGTHGYEGSARIGRVAPHSTNLSVPPSSRPGMHQCTNAPPTVDHSSTTLHISSLGFLATSTRTTHVSELHLDLVPAVVFHLGAQRVRVRPVFGVRVGGGSGAARVRCGGNQSAKVCEKR